jgi:hypothetical protein
MAGLATIFHVTYHYFSVRNSNTTFSAENEISVAVFGNTLQQKLHCTEVS